MKQTPVEIILATYNGEAYIAEFLKSLHQQTFRDFRILVRDDCSTDNTVEIIEKFSDTLKISIITDQKGNLGFYENFSEILSYAKAEYLLLADQDDIWDQNKLLTYLEVFQKTECLAIFSKFKLIDQNGKLIGDEMLQGFDPVNTHNAYYWGNNATGCTMALRRTLLNDVRLDNAAHYHDWKIALTAARSNGLYFLQNPLTHYRVHQLQSSGFNNRKHPLSNMNQTLKNFKRGGYEQVKNLNSIVNDALYFEDQNEIMRSLELHMLMSSNKFEVKMLFLTLRILFNRDAVSYKSLLYKNLINICRLA